VNKIQIGDVEIIALTDGAAGLRLKLDEVFPTIQAAQWEPYLQRYPQVFTDAATWRIYYDCYIVRSRDYTCLVDTGVGTGPYMGQLYGQLLDSLREAGISPQDVDGVFLTHAHSDHVGLNFTAEGKPTFPNARYILQRVDWDFYQLPHVKMSIAPYIDRLLTPLKQLGVLDLLQDEQSLTEELTAVFTPGHSPGHMSLLISSQGQKALIGGDAFIHPVQVTEFDWCAIFDMDKEEIIATRRHLLDWLEQEKIVLAAGHFPYPGFGHIICQDGRHFWQEL